MSNLNIYNMNDDVVASLAITELGMNGREVSRLKKAYSESTAVEFKDLFNYLTGSVETWELCHHKKAIKDSYKTTAIGNDDSLLQNRLDSLSDKAIFSKAAELRIKR